MHLVLRNVAQVGLHGAHNAYGELLQHQVLQAPGLLREREQTLSKEGQPGESTCLGMEPQGMLLRRNDQPARVSALSWHLTSDWPQKELKTGTSPKRSKLHSSWQADLTGGRT